MIQSNLRITNRDLLTRIENHVKEDLIFENIHMVDVSFEEFVRDTFFELNHKYPTVYKDSGKLQCEETSDRSIGDIYRICKTYYPEITVEIFFEVFISNINIDDLDNSYFVGHYCNDICKRVWTNKRINRYYSLLDDDVADEYGYTLDDYFTAKT